MVPHFSSGIVERAKRERTWKSPHARKGDTRLFTRGVIFTCARVSHALLSQRKNGGSLSLSAFCNSFVALHSEDLCPLAVRRSGMFSNLELRTLEHPRSCTYILNVYRSNSLFTETNTSCTSVIRFPGSSLTEPRPKSLYGRTSVRRPRATPLALRFHGWGGIKAGMRKSWIFTEFSYMANHSFNPLCKLSIASTV